MLQEAIDLQNTAVTSLYNKVLGAKRELTFRAPTGSGKTRMMSDLMNRILTEKEDVVFLVSTLSKGGLAKQNYDAFELTSKNGTFTKLSPYLINTETSTEEALYIPTDHNVYVLPRDLYKEGGKLMQGAMLSFLRTITENFIGTGLNKKIYLIKDECHQATNNLDDLSANFFTKVINFSATPNLGRGQNPDVQITDDEAVRAKLIKRVIFGDPNDSIEKALDKYREIKEQYTNLLGISPCLIIQISNQNKADYEWNNSIKPALDKLENQGLKWMMLVNPVKKGEKVVDLSDTNDAIKKKLPKDQWKDYAKKAAIDVIIFKMVISEGWDIPRACMLYQVRDSQSKQLDEQVMGRVRRNPRLSDFETLSEEAQELATTAWVWGIPPQGMKQVNEVALSTEIADVQSSIRVKTIKIDDLTERRAFDVSNYLDSQPSLLTHTDIFTLYKRLNKCSVDLQQLCYEYSQNDVIKWLNFVEHIDDIRKRYNDFICDYEKSMKVDKETSFPVKSTYVETDQTQSLEDWVWCRPNGSTIFSFDSQAERQWASLLEKIAYKYGETISKEDAERYLWGKNFPYNSEIKYEYYANGIHASFPDFVMKDKKGIVHLFEVKSLNHSNDTNIDEEEYKNKMRALEACYLACSKILKDHYFYLPRLIEDKWEIMRYADGVKTQMNKKTFEDSFK